MQSNRMKEYYKIMENVLLATEVDLYIETMRCFALEDIGNKHWLDWHGRLSKLNQQAILEASEMREEYVKEELVSSGKISILVHEAILINIWKKKVLPQIMKFESDPSNTFTVYSVLYHESICLSLLETVLFHSSSCETLEEVSLDLLDYCCEAATQLLGYNHTEPSEDESAQTEILRQKADLQFDIGIRAISILRYFAEYLESLPLSITSRMFTTHDVPLLLVELICCKPWIRNEKDKTMKYIGSKWNKVSGESLIKLSPTEAQIWIGLRQLLLDPRCVTHYQFTDFRKNQLIKQYLHDVVLDQLSPLIELKQWLCQLAMSNLPPPGKSPIILEILPQIKDNIISQNQTKWKEIARKQINIFFKQNHEDMVEMAQSLSEAYNSDILEKLEQVQINSCGGCGRNATKKCSRCKNEWYCSRNCQVKHWPQHKETCDLSVGNN